MIDVTPATLEPGHNPPSRRPAAVPAHARAGSGAPMRAAEIATVCMGALLPELREFVPSARLAFPRVPIHVYTDEPGEAGDILAALPVEGVHLHPATESAVDADLSRVARHSDYWRPAPIWWKIRALRDRLAARPDGGRDGVLVADCDIVWRAGFERAYHGEVALSPFYWGRRDLRLSHDRGAGLLQHRDGEFNAGLVLSRSRAFADWWMRAYLAGEGGFYEQGCLDLVPGLFETDYISPLHNWGKWRFASPHGAVRSYHQHLGEPARRLDVGAIALAARRAAAEARAALAANPDFRS